jgi:tRNA(Ile2) C34 agmatinyltransferase TiaS
MPAKLQCEICGGKLIGKPGGIFECENCGTEYSTEWAKAKIQEITGTVKVEGTVEVAGKVQIENPVTIDNSSNIGNFSKGLRFRASHPQGGETLP